MHRNKIHTAADRFRELAEEMKIRTAFPPFFSRSAEDDDGFRVRTGKTIDWSKGTWRPVVKHEDIKVYAVSHVPIGQPMVAGGITIYIQHGKEEPQVIPDNIIKEIIRTTPRPLFSYEFLQNIKGYMIQNALFTHPMEELI